MALYLLSHVCQTVRRRPLLARLLGCLLLGLVPVGGSEAATYYVASTGNNRSHLYRRRGQ